MFILKHTLFNFIFIIAILSNTITAFGSSISTNKSLLALENNLKNEYEENLQNYKIAKLQNTFSVEQRMNINKYTNFDIPVYMYIDDDEQLKHYNTYSPINLAFDLFEKQTGLSFNLQCIEVDPSIAIEKQLKSIQDNSLCLDIVVSNNLSLFDLNNPEVVVTSPIIFEELYILFNPQNINNKSQEDLAISYDSSTFSLQSNTDTEDFNLISKSPQDANTAITNEQIDLFYSTTSNLPSVTRNSKTLYQYASISQYIPNLTYALYGISTNNKYTDLIDILETCITNNFVTSINNQLEAYREYIKIYTFFQSLTEAEKEYIATNDFITIYYNESKNLLYNDDIDNSNNKYQGLLVDIFNQISTLTNFEIKYIMPEDLYIKNSSIKEDSPINLLTLYNNLVMNKLFSTAHNTHSGYAQTPTLFNYNLEILKNNNLPDITKTTDLIFSKNGTTLSFLLNTEEFIKANNLSLNNLTIYDTEYDLIQALSYGEIDYAFVAPGTTTYYSNDTTNHLSSAYHNQSCLDFPTYEWKFLVHDINDVSTLNSIISKAIMTIDYTSLTTKWLPSQYEYTLYNKINNQNVILASFIVFLVFISITILFHFYTAHKSYVAKLLNTTSHDSLTGLRNLKCFEKNMTNYTKGNFIIAKIKNIKQANQIYGIPKIDTLIKEYANFLVSSYGEENVYRISGASFYIYISDNTNIKSLVKNLDSNLKNGFCVENKHYDIETIIVGTNITSFYNIEKNYITYLKYLIDDCKSKKNKRYAILDESTFKNLIDKQIIRTSLLKITKDNIFPYYQPFIDNKTKKVKGCEVLARLSIDGKIVPAYNFIDIADTLGVLKDIDKMILEQTIALRLELLSKGLIDSDFYFSINFSAQFIRKLTIEELYEITRRFNIRSLNFLQIEILEEALTEYEIEKTKRIISEFKLHTAIDDFSTGHSTISRLTSFNFDAIKMDKSLLPINLTELDKQIYISLLTMISNFSLSIVVEGVETIEHVQFLEKTDVSTLQGYFFSKPMPKDEFVNYIVSHNI